MIKKINELAVEDVAPICDHTFLYTPEFYRGKDIKDSVNICNKEFKDFLEKMIYFPRTPYALCVRPEYISHAKNFLQENWKIDTKIAAVGEGFPNGDIPTEFKINAAKLAVKEGANEIDFVLNYKALKEGDLNYVKRELEAIGKFGLNNNVLTKLILEISELDNEQIKMACKLADTYGIDFVKTSTGFSSGGATEEALKIMKKNFPRGIKMSGGVDEKNVYGLLEAASGRDDGMIDLDPLKIRIGESGLIKKLLAENTDNSGY
ncbi:MAG: deoxyribose-phosphate aldolase [Candidatus Nanoarchaeia archaeon]|nr:deoxyribose-phosphate aldolase [Candidatus Nanoarchaeia archaeon]MDD5741367.1 deoxyribose-phosphate aldolase [Candidatus Nanoarchaeia archaeon]